MHRQLDPAVAGWRKPLRHNRAGARRRRARGGRRWALAAVAGVLLAAVVGGGLSLWLQGYRLYVVHTGSMTPAYRPGDLVLDRPAGPSYRTGEVITFRHSDRTTDVVTHRVVGTSERGITTKGDANRTADAWTIRPDQVQGRVQGAVSRLGYLVVYLQQPAGIASVLSAAAAIMLLWAVCFPTSPSSKELSTGRRDHEVASVATVL
jgi:signal peptidase